MSWRRLGARILTALLWVLAGLVMLFYGLAALGEWR